MYVATTVVKADSWESNNDVYVVSSPATLLTYHAHIDPGMGGNYPKRLPEVRRRVQQEIRKAAQQGSNTASIFVSPASRFDEHALTRIEVDPQ